MKKKWPVLQSDEEAERFVEEADLTEYDFSEMVPVRFEFEPKAAQINMRVPQSLLDALKAAGKAPGHTVHAAHPRADGTGNSPARSHASPDRHPTPY